MKSITMYQSVDGKTFKSKDDCVKHEVEYYMAQNIFSDLNPIPTQTDFVNGYGYVQQDLNTVGKVKANFHQLCNKSIGKDVPFGFIGRYLPDTSSLGSYFTRFLCIDSKGREWGQPYYATHPDQAYLQEAVK